MRITLGKFGAVDKKDLLEAWRRVNDAGNGYPPDSDDMEGARDEYLTTVSLDNGFVAYDVDGGDIIVVMDANGPWACDVTDFLTETENV